MTKSQFGASILIGYIRAPRGSEWGKVTSESSVQACCITTTLDRTRRMSTLAVVVVQSVSHSTTTPANASGHPI